jgi:hypothetical protein
VQAVLAGPGCVAEKLNAWNGRPVPDMSPQRVGPACCGLAAGCPTRRGPARIPGQLLCAGRQGVAGTVTECKAACLRARLGAGRVVRRQVPCPPSAAAPPLGLPAFLRHFASADCFQTFVSST